MLHRRQWTRPDTLTSAQLDGVAVADGRAFAAGNRGVLLGRVGGGWVRLLVDGVAGEPADCSTSPRPTTGSGSGSTGRAARSATTTATAGR
jgi:hypothetical protein